jgi:hypothetical protein
MVGAWWGYFGVYKLIPRFRFDLRLLLVLFLCLAIRYFCAYSLYVSDAIIGAGALAVKRVSLCSASIFLFSPFYVVDFEQGISGAWYSIAELKGTAIESHLNTLESNNNGHGWSPQTFKRLVKLQTNMKTGKGES